MLAGLSMIRLGGAETSKVRFDETYRDVPDEQKRLLQEFRANHPYRELDFDGTPWRYIA